VRPALKLVWSVALSKVKEAAKGSDGWTVKEFADAALLLLKAKQGAVLLADMEACISPSALQALIQANRFSLRPYSDWACDITADAFEGPGGLDKVITVASAVERYCLGTMRAQLEQASKVSNGGTLPQQLTRLANW
jgi:hypothetical protein